MGMIDKLIEELKNVALEPTGFLVVIVGKERLSEQNASITFWNFDNLTYETAAMLLYEIKELEHKLVTLEWEERKKEGYI